jgi:(p)ppGpp synthase/HD superfamily hydrolase
VTDVLTLVAAVLHDTLEDTETTPFGPTIRDLVQEVTDDKSLHKAERKALQGRRAPAAL